jgi:prophage antirepressor-like protein
MDIVRAFTDLNDDRHIHINIIGTVDDPLFQAGQVGKFLGLVNIRESIKDFDEDEKVALNSTDAIGREQTTIFLTELGLYRLLNASRKPYARRFQKWVAKVVKEIRMTGKYELEQRIDIAVKALEAKDKETEQLMKQHADGQKIAEKKMTHDALMTANKDTPLVYLAELPDFGTLPDGRFFVKFGETDDVVGRLPYLRKEYGNIWFVKHCICTRPHKYEQWLKQQRIFVQCKYKGTLKGLKREEVLAVTPSEFEQVKRLIDRNQSMFTGWTPEQTVKKMSQQTEQLKIQKEMLTLQKDTFRDMFNLISIMTDCESRITAEKEIAGAIRSFYQNTPIQTTNICAMEMEEQTDDDIESDGNTELQSIRSDISEINGVLDTHNSPPVEDMQNVVVPVLTTPNTDTNVIFPVPTPNNDEVHLFPPQPKRKMGRPPKTKTAPATDADTPLQRFIDECFDTSDPDAKTHVALVRARHRLWRRSHVNREETKNMIDFFKDRFRIVLEMDGDHDMRSSFYVGLAMKPWVPPTAPENQTRTDIDAFVREECEVHVMGRVRNHDLWEAFAAWKLQKEPTFEPSDKERSKFIAYMKHSFVYHTGVPITKSAVGAPGLYGMYLKAANEETREVGWNRSPNTHCSVYRLDARGNIVGVIDSQDAFAHNVAKKSAQHMCVEFTKCFKDGMRGVMLGDGYCYMRSKDHATMMNSRS